jgi:hypothetical protein
MRHWLLYLYPAAWRRRYREEFAALLEVRRPSPRQTVDIVRGALDARLRSHRSMVPGRAIAMAYRRNEIRDELHAILAVHEELGSQHEQHLVEGFLDRLEEGAFLPPARSTRQRRRTLVAILAATVIAAGGGSAAIQHYSPLDVAQGHPLPSITRLDGPAPAFFRRMPLTHYTSRSAASLLGSVIVDGYGGPHPYAFVNFYLRYHNCQITPRGAFRLTIETVGYRVTARRRDGRIFVAHTGPLNRWTQPAVFLDRNLTASLTFPTPQQGLYYWRVEVPSAKGCAWQIYYVGS